MPACVSSVVERGELGRGASHVAAGMLAPVAEASFAERDLLALGLESAARWPAFARGLLDSGGLDPGLRECGTLLVAPDRDQAAALDRERRLRESLGLPVRRLRPSEARRMEPGLAPAINAALDVPGDHAVDPRALTAALAAAAAAADVTLRPRTPATGLLVEDGAAAGVALEGGERVPAVAVVVAAGCWSGGLEGIPREARVPVRPVKGQILRLRDPSGPGLLTRVLRTEEAYLVPRGDGRYVLGATVEERGFDTTVTAGAVHELLRAAADVLPGIGELELEEAAAGLRPGTPDNAPVLGPSMRARVALGHRAPPQRHPARPRHRRPGRRGDPGRAAAGAGRPVRRRAVHGRGGRVNVVVNGAGRATCPRARRSPGSWRASTSIRPGAASPWRSTPRSCAAVRGSRRVLADGMRVEILTAIQGG